MTILMINVHTGITYFESSLCTNLHFLLRSANMLGFSLMRLIAARAGVANMGGRDAEKQ